MRARMKAEAAVWGVMIAAGLLMAAPAAVAAQERIETIDKTVPFPDKGTLRLKNFSGCRV